MKIGEKYKSKMCVYEILDIKGQWIQFLVNGERIITKQRGTFQKDLKEGRKQLI